MATVYADKGHDYSPVFFGDKGNLACVVSTYEASSLAAGSTIRMCKVPANCTVVDGYVSVDALGTGVTIDIGDEDVADRFYNDMDVASAAVVASRFNLGIPYSYAAEKWITITTAGATATGTITLVLFYVME